MAVAQFFAQYGTAITVFVAFAWGRGLSLVGVAGVVAFVLVAYLGIALFGRLSGTPRAVRASHSKWMEAAQSAGLGGVLAGVAEWSQLLGDYVHFVWAIPAGLVFALVVSAWRQRWRERMLYRFTLSHGA